MTTNTDITPESEKYAWGIYSANTLRKFAADMVSIHMLRHNKFNEMVELAVLSWLDAQVPIIFNDWAAQEGLSPTAPDDPENMISWVHDVAGLSPCAVKRVVDMMHVTTVRRATKSVFWVCPICERAPEKVWLGLTVAGDTPVRLYDGRVKPITSVTSEDLREHLVCAGVAGSEYAVLRHKQDRRDYWVPYGRMVAWLWESLYGAGSGLPVLVAEQLKLQIMSSGAES